MADDRAKTGAWKGSNPRDGRGSFHPLKRRRQWMDSASPMVGHASVNGLSNATQWMERRDSMDGTGQFNGWTTTGPSRAAKRACNAANLCQMLAESDEVDVFV